VSQIHWKELCQQDIETGLKVGWGMEGKSNVYAGDMLLIQMKGHNSKPNGTGLRWNKQNTPLA
jgi:hypothetical protein